MAIGLAVHSEYNHLWESLSGTTQLDVPYTTMLLPPSTEQEVEVSGTWRGVSVGNITQQYDEC